MAGTKRSGRQRNSFGPYYIRTKEGDWGPFSLNDIRNQHAAGRMPAEVEIRDAGRNVMVLVGDLLADAVDQSKAGETAVGTNLPPIVIETIHLGDGIATTMNGAVRTNTTLSVTALPGHLDPIDANPLERRWVPPPKPPPPPPRPRQGTRPSSQPRTYQTTAPTRRRTGGGSRRRRGGRGTGAGIDPTVLVLVIAGIAVVVVLLVVVVAHGRSTGKPAIDRFLPRNR